MAKTKTASPSGETQAFIPTKTIDCSCGDIFAVVFIVSILVLFTIAGIIVGSISAKNLDTCSKVLPFGDKQTFSIQYNATTLNNIYVQGDSKTFIYYDPTLTNRIEVSVERTSLLDTTYRGINTSVYTTAVNGTQSIRIETSLPSTDFTNCYLALRIIRIPASLLTVNLQASVYMNDLYFGPDPSASSTTTLRVKTLTIMGGTNFLNITQVQSGQIFVSGRKGQINLARLFGAVLITSTTGDIFYKDLSAAAILKLYSSKGSLEGSDINMVGGSGNVTLIANKKKQVHRGIKGAKVIEFGTVDSEIDVTLNSDDFQGELQIQSPSLDKTAIKPIYHTVSETSLSSRKQYPTNFGNDAAEIFTPTYAAVVGASSFTSTNLMKIRFKTSGVLKNLVL